MTLAIAGILPVSGASPGNAKSHNPYRPVTKAPKGLAIYGKAAIRQAPAQAPADPLGVPWSCDFSSGGLDGFTVLSGNSDNFTWDMDGMGGEFATISGSVYAYDDWLITPPLMLQKGKAYEFSLDAFTGMNVMGSMITDTSLETLEVYWGTENTIEAMTNLACERISFNDPVTMKGIIVPREDGPVYIGIHAISDDKTFFVNVDNLQLQAGKEATRPGRVTGLTVVPDDMCGPEVQINFTAPSLDMYGDPLDGALTKIEVFRDGESVKTFLSPDAGAKLSFLDTLVPTGERTYSISAYNSTGEGESVETTVFVGPRVPAPPSDIVLAETLEDGLVSLSWTPVTHDGNGNYVNPDMVYYNVQMLDKTGERTLISEDAESGIEFEAAPREQMLVRAALRAITDAGQSAEVFSDIIIAGPAYEAPFNESFSNAAIHYPLLTRTVEGEAEWYTMSESAGVPSQDGDNGYLMMMSDPGASAEIVTGKINLKDLHNPCLSFYTYNIARMAGYPHSNELVVEVRTPGGEFKEMRRVVMSQLGDEEGWYRVNVPLHEYAGKKIVVRFTGIGHNMTYTLLDNITIGSIESHDLSARSLSVPDHKLRPGSRFNVKLMVENNGYEAASCYTVSLFCNGEKVQEKAGEPIASSELATILFDVDVPPTCERALQYHAVIDYAPDADLQNNTSGNALAEIALSGLPSVTSLSAKGSPHSVALSWAAPDLSAPASEYVFEDFESYESWATDGIGDWRFIDGDKGYLGGFANMSLPGIPPRSQQSWFIVDNEGFDPTQFYAHSGGKYLGQMYVYSSEESYIPVDCDDWAIFPELDGNEQTVSFWARSLTSDARDQFEVLVSSTGSDRADFTKIDAVDEAPASWKRYDYELPEGTRYIAIRCTSPYGFMLLIDDVSFIRSVSPESLELIGYNIYCDGQKLNAEPVSETVYEAAATDDASHDYAVTALYTLGESRAAGISSSNGLSEMRATRLQVSAGTGLITVRGADGLDISVFTPDGLRVARTAGSSVTDIRVQPGMYIVRAGTHTFKITVR